MRFKPLSQVVMELVGGITHDLAEALHLSFGTDGNKVPGLKVDTAGGREPAVKNILQIFIAHWFICIFADTSASEYDFFEFHWIFLSRGE